MNIRNHPSITDFPGDTSVSRRVAQVLTLILAVAIVSPGRAASPTEELLGLVPDDVAFCLVVRDLHGHMRALLASPFAQSFPKSALAGLLKQSPEIQKLVVFDQQIRTHLGVDLAGICDRLASEAVVLAYWPNPPGKTDQDQGLVLVRGRDPRGLADFIDRLNRVQKESGDLTALEPRDFRGATYYQRVDPKGKHFYYVHGPVLVFSGQEKVLCQAIARDQAEVKEPVLRRQLRWYEAEQALATLWINPRAFDFEMERNAGQAVGREGTGQRAFLRYWKALDGVALSLYLEADLRLRLTVRARTEDLPAGARRFLSESARRSELWDRFPEKSLLTIAGRLDLPAALEMAEAFLAQPARQQLDNALEQHLGGPAEMDFRKDILPGLGPDMGFCLLAPPATQKAWTPQGLLALRVGPGQAKSGLRVDQAVFTLTTFYARLAMMVHNLSGKEPIRLRSMLSDKGEVKYLTGDKVILPGLQPAFALRDGYLVLATSPEALRFFGEARGPAPVQAGAMVPLLRLSVREVRGFVKQWRDSLVQASMDQNHLTREEAGCRLENLLAVLELIDHIELARSAGGGSSVLTLRIETVPPLRAAKEK